LLREILRIAKEQSVNAILIAGDVYDRSVPPVEAVDIFDDFITDMSDADIAVFIIAGNHDSAERLDFGARIMSSRGVHFAGSEMKVVTLTDAYGSLNVWLMPFMRSVNAIATLETASVDTNERNVILSHQFVVSVNGEPVTGGSERVSVGGTDAIDASLFDSFDYVALGHIHRPQSVVRETVRYSGSPYRYSFDECSHMKSAVVLDIKVKNELSIEFVSLVPSRDLFRLKCKLEELTDFTIPRDAYVEVTLTDDEPIVDAIAKVRAIYHNTIQLKIENKYSKTAGTQHTLSGDDIKEKTPLELFAGFFEAMHDEPISAEQNEIIELAIAEGQKNETN
jgi:exonuclease SbcD